MKQSPSVASKSLAFIIAALFFMTTLYPGRIFAADERELFRNINIYRVENGPTVATTFRIDQLCLVTYVSTYHYNGGMGQTPGTIALRHEDGTIYGPWAASGGPDPAVNPTNMYWVCQPNFVLKPGVYTVIDSHPASWSWNSSSAGGMTVIKGRPVAEVANQPVRAPKVTQAPAPTQKAAADILVSKTLEPSSTAQLVAYKDEVGVIIPGGTLEGQQTVTISRAPNLPAHPSHSFDQLAVYDISMGNVHEFKESLTIEIAYDPSRLPSNISPEKALSVGWWDVPNKRWISTPFAVDAARNVMLIPTTHLTYFEVLALVKGWELKETEHFYIYYDPKSKYDIVPSPKLPTVNLADDVGTLLEEAYKAYEKAGYSMRLTFIPKPVTSIFLGTLVGAVVVGGITTVLGTVAGGVAGGPLGAIMGGVKAGSVGINAGGALGAYAGAISFGNKTYVILDKDTVSAVWNEGALLGEIRVPLHHMSYAELRHDLAHELFHAVQNGYFATPEMGGDLWFMEATADYAPVAHGISKPDALPVIAPTYFQQPITLADKVHDYSTSHFIEWQLKGDGAIGFKALWDAVAAFDSTGRLTATALERLDEYNKTRKSTLHTLFHGFAADTFFNSNSPLELPTGTTLATSGIVSQDKSLSATDSPLSYDIKLPANYTAILSRIAVGFNASQTERALKVIASATSERDKVTVSAVVLPNDKRVPGGVTQKPVPLYSYEGSRGTKLTVKNNETLYIMAVNSQATDVTLNLKVSDAAITISPPTASVDAGKNVTFTTPGITEKVLWTVQEGASGGTMSDAGVYSAPDKAGTYHVVATLASDSATNATAAATVTAATQGSGKGSRTVTPTPASGEVAYMYKEDGTPNAIGIKYTISGGGDLVRTPVGNTSSASYTGKLVAGSTLTLAGSGWSIPEWKVSMTSFDKYPMWLAAKVTVDGNTKVYDYYTPKGESMNTNFSLSVPIPEDATHGSFEVSVCWRSAYRDQCAQVGGSLSRERPAEF
ncbi:MAG: hypothetical protein WCU74_04510 [Candidatus Omnitrophota bacterium]